MPERTRPQHAQTVLRRRQVVVVTAASATAVPNACIPVPHEIELL